MLVFAVGVLGLCLGSFTNVLIARVPKGEDWVREPSHCPRCLHRLAWHDNIPLLSWLWLRRKCRFCHAPISGRYPLVEALVCGLVVASYVTFGDRLSSVALAYLAVICVALVFIDIDVRRLPDSLVLPTYLVVAALLVGDALTTGQGEDLVRAGIGIAVMGGFYLTMWVIYPSGLGLGDVKAAGLLGMTAGFLGWPHLAVGGLLGPLLGGLWVVVGLATGRLHRKSRVAYGPALITGAWLGFLAGPAIGGAYLDLVTLGA